MFNRFTERRKMLNKVLLSS